MATILKRECVHATYFKSKEDRKSDVVVVKEKLHIDDGTIRNNLRLIKNYQRTFYITKKQFQNHNDKKEWEYIEFLDTYSCTQAELVSMAYQKLYDKKLFNFLRLAELSNNPYLYGTHVSTPVLIAKEYQEKYPDLQTARSLAIMDYEWDVIHGHGDILAGAVTFQGKTHIAVTKEFLKPYLHIPDLENKIIELIKKETRHIVGDRQKEIIISIVDAPWKVVKKLFGSVHKWQPDFLGFWNIKGDINKIIEMLEKANIDPALIFSDPSIPDEFKYFNWREGKEYRIKANGERTKTDYIDLWHVVESPSSFKCICLMASYRVVRARDQLRTSYSLDSILHDELSFGKLHFDFIPECPQTEWHKIMQSKYQLEYLAYLSIDVQGPDILDAKTNDIARSIPGFLGISELSTLKSNPTKLANRLHYVLLNSNRVICSVSENMADELDKLTPSLDGWIGILAAELEHDLGIKLLADIPTINTNITIHSHDNDVVGAYPASGVACNISKTTTLLETCSISGGTDILMRHIGINMSNVRGNCIDLAHHIYGLPNLPDLLTEFKQHFNLDGDVPW